MPVTLALPPSENRLTPVAPGEGYTAEVMTASPSCAKTSTLERSTTTLRRTRPSAPTVTGARDTEGKDGLKSVSPERVRST